MRPVQLMPYPVFTPYVCTKCGVGGGTSREFFIDIGVDNDLDTDMRMHGAIYYCNECVQNFITDTNRLISQWRQEHSAFSGENAEPATFDWEQEVDVATIELDVNDGRGPTNADRSGSSLEPAVSNYTDTSEQLDRTPEELVDISSSTDSTSLSGEEPRGISF